MNNKFSKKTQKKTVRKYSVMASKDFPSLMLKMMVSYGIFFLIILFLFLFIFRTNMKNMQNEYQNQTKNSFSNQARVFEKDLDIMDVYCRQLMQNDLFRKLAEPTDDSIMYLSNGKKLQTALATDVYSESLLPISDVFVYYPKSDYVVSPNYFITSDRFYNWIQKLEATQYENWLETLTNEKSFYQFISLDSFLRSHKNAHRYMYIYNMDDINYMDIDAVVCFIFDETELLSLFDCVTYEENYLISIVNPEGTPILKLSSNADMESIIPSFENSKSSSRQLENQEFGVYQSPITGYRYLFHIPASENQVLGREQALFMVIAVLSVILGAALIYHLSKQNVEPILTLNQELHKSVEVQNYLQNMVDHQRPIIFHSYIRRLLTGTVTLEEADYMKEYLRISDTQLTYNCIYICYYNNATEAPEGELHLQTPEQTNELILSTLQQFLGQEVRYFSPSDRTFALLLTCPKVEEKEFVFRTHNMIVQLHNHLLETYGIWLFAGIGKNTDEFINVWECYQQAVEAVSYTSKSYFYFPYEFTKKDSNAFYYPPEISTKLIHFITSGNADQVKELFKLIHQENMEERTLSIHLLKYLLSDIKNTLLKARFALPANTPDDVLRKIDHKFDEHTSFTLCEDIALELCKYFTVEDKSDDLISTIEKYLTANFNDPSMGLNKIADEFEISESYFSHMFKEKKGVNFSTYLEKIRMDEAVRLIKETDISLNELYISVGYNNINSFRRVFKKTYGITPSAMRDNPGIGV